MCTRAERGYTAATFTPKAAGTFAGAAVLNLLTPADWQICRDVELAAFEMSKAIAAGANEVMVAVTVHSTGVEVAVTPDVGADQRHRLTPRAAFASIPQCRG